MECGRNTDRTVTDKGREPSGEGSRLPGSGNGSCHNLEEKADYFKWMLDEYEGNAYLSDMETYELLYLNPSSCETLGRKFEQAAGKKCYEVIQGRTSPCPFCTNHLLTEDEFYEWEFYNPVLERTFLIKDRIVNWEGRRARLELSHDNYSMEYNLAKKDREKEAIVRTIPGGFARMDAEDMKKVLWYGGGFLEIDHSSSIHTISPFRTGRKAFTPSRLFLFSFLYPKYFFLYRV